MLKFYVNHREKHYNIAFDVAVPASILLHEEFAPIIEGLSEEENFRIETNGFQTPTEIVLKLNAMGHKMVDVDRRDRCAGGSA